MEEHTPVSAPQALEDLEVCYRDFIEKLKKSKASSVGEVMGNFFRAQGNPRVSYAVEEFDAAMTERLTTLTAVLETCPAEEACRLAVQALELMLFYPVPRQAAGDRQPLCQAHHTPADAAQSEEAVEGPLPVLSSRNIFQN